MFYEEEKEEHKKNCCVCINVFTKCEDKKDWEKCDWKNAIGKSVILEKTIKIAAFV